MHGASRYKTMLKAHARMFFCMFIPRPAPHILYSPDFYYKYKYKYKCSSYSYSYSYSTV